MDSLGELEVVEEANRLYVDTLRAQLEKLDCKTPDNQEILLDWDGIELDGIATVTIKSGAKNALSGKMISQLTNIIDQLYERQAELRGVLIRGDGGSFCSGSDLVTVRATAGREMGLKLAQIMQFNMMRLDRLPALTLAYLEGYALGGGAELATSADLRIMSS